MKFVDKKGLTKALQKNRDYRETGSRFLDSLPTVFALKRLGVKDTDPIELTIEDFQNVLTEFLSVVAEGDPTSNFGLQLFNIFSRKLVRTDWPRSTPWTRYAKQEWEGILGATKSGHKLSWKFVNGYAVNIASKLPAPYPAWVLAAFLYRRPSDLTNPAEAETWEDLIKAFKLYFHLNDNDALIFDYNIPENLPELVPEEMTRAEVIDALAAVEPSTQLGLRLSSYATGESELHVTISECALKMGQVLLFGPPGTGKTYWAIRSALRITGHQDEEEAKQDERLRLVAWHPSTSYEDFMRGVDVKAGTITPRPGVFQQFCETAEKRPDHLHVLIIDEINRGNTVAILGELLYALEFDKRDTTVRLSDGFDFKVPKNLFILATANTADRSIAALDKALGRRFARVEVSPKPEVLGATKIVGVELASILDALNRSISTLIDKEHRIGHAYFMESGGKPISTVSELTFVMRYRIIPLLQDYSLDDISILEDVLGQGFVDGEEQKIKVDVFTSPEKFAAALKQIPGLKM